MHCPGRFCARTWCCGTVRRRALFTSCVPCDCRIGSVLRGRPRSWQPGGPAPVIARRAPGPGPLRAPGVPPAPSSATVHGMAAGCRAIRHSNCRANVRCRVTGSGRGALYMSIPLPIDRAGHVRAAGQGTDRSAGTARSPTAPRPSRGACAGGRRIDRAEPPPNTITREGIRLAASPRRCRAAKRASAVRAAPAPARAAARALLAVFSARLGSTRGIGG